MDVAGSTGRENASLVEQLFDQGHTFDFFQAVRLLERIARNETPPDGVLQWSPVGRDHPPREEVVRFRVVPSLTFSAGPVEQIRRNVSPDADEATPLAEMIVSFIGLTGPQGVLPQHYTSLVIERCHVANKDETLKDFFDLFNHRTISLFYRAWEKYRFPVGYEQSRLKRGRGAGDLFTFCLHSLVGLGTKGLRRRLHVDDETILFYGGHFAHQPRSAVALEEILGDYFGVPVQVEQFCGRWLYLTKELCSTLCSPDLPEGQNSGLGKTVIAGKRVWDVQSKFRIRLGPLGYQDFLRFIPSGDALRRLGDLVRLYVGPEFTFDAEVVLKAAEVPKSHLGRKSPELATHLAWNSWLKSSREFERDADDAVFRFEDC